MFIVIESNPQLYNVADGVKVFNTLKVASMYARSRGFSSPFGNDPESIKNQLSQPGKSLSSVSSGFNITILNTDAGDEAETAAPPVNPVEDELRAQLAKVTGEKNAAELVMKTAVEAHSVAAENILTLRASNAELEKKNQELNGNIDALLEQKRQVTVTSSPEVAAEALKAAEATKTEPAKTGGKKSNTDAKA